MAETPENNEASADEVGRGDERSEAVPETPASEEPTAETTEDAPATETEAEAPAAAAPAPKAGATRRDKLEAKRAERRVEAGKRPSRAACAARRSRAGPSRCARAGRRR